MFCIHFRENGNSKAILTRKTPKFEEVHKCTQLTLFSLSFFQHIPYILTGRKSRLQSLCFCETNRPIGCMLHNLINVSLNLLLFVRCKSWKQKIWIRFTFGQWLHFWLKFLWITYSSDDVSLVFPWYCLPIKTTYETPWATYGKLETREKWNDVNRFLNSQCSNYVWGLVWTLCGYVIGHSYQVQRYMYIWLLSALRHMAAGKPVTWGMTSIGDHNW